MTASFGTQRGQAEPVIVWLRLGRAVSKAALTEAAWHDIAVTDNSLVQAVAGLRRTLGNQDNGTPYIPRGTDTRAWPRVCNGGARRHVASSTLPLEPARTPEGSAGWLLPVEPLLCPTAQPDAWAPALALLRERAL